MTEKKETPATEVSETTPVIVTQLNEPLPEEAVSPHPTKPYLSTIKAIYVVERFNKVFGLGGWFIHNEFVEKVKVSTKNGDVDNVIIKATFNCPKYGILIPDIYGGNDNPDLGDAYKGACTDALTKIGSYLGVGMDVYKGLGDKGNKKSGNLPSKAGTHPISPNSASNEEWHGAPKAVRPASAKQIGFIKGLLEQKGIDREKPEIKTKLEKLTSAGASAWIDKLNTMEDSVPTIEIEQVVDEEIK